MSFDCQLFVGSSEHGLCHLCGLEWRAVRSDSLRDLAKSCVDYAIWIVSGWTWVGVHAVILQSWSRLRSREPNATKVRELFGRQTGRQAGSLPCENGRPR